jgi:hypothetical protein
MEYSIDEMMEIFRRQTRVDPSNFSHTQCPYMARVLTWIDRGTNSHHLTYFCFRNAYVDNNGNLKGVRQVDGCKISRRFNPDTENFECIPLGEFNNRSNNKNETM